MAQTQTLNINQLQREIQKLERELVILKRTNLWSIDRRVSQYPRLLRGLAGGVKLDFNEPLFWICRRVLMSASVIYKVGSAYHLRCNVSDHTPNHQKT